MGRDSFLRLCELPWLLWSGISVAWPLSCTIQAVAFSSCFKDMTVLREAV